MQVGVAGWYLASPEYQKFSFEISDEKSWHLDAPGCNPRLLTFRSFARMVKCDVSNFDVSVKNTIRVRMSQPQNATSVVKDFSPDLRHVVSR